MPNVKLQNKLSALCKELELDCFEIAVGDDAHFSAALPVRWAEELVLDLIDILGGHCPSKPSFLLAIPSAAALVCNGINNKTI